MSKKQVYEAIIEENKAFWIRLEAHLATLIENIDFVKTTIHETQGFLSEIEGQEMEQEMINQTK